MGLIIDTGVLIRLEREPAAVDFSTYKRATNAADFRRMPGCTVEVLE
jgi:hypothetical protein